MAENEQQTFVGIGGGDILPLLRRRKWVLLAPFGVLLVGAVLLALVLPPQFQASATIEAVDRQLLDKFFQQMDFTLPHKPFLTTIAEVIKSPTFLRDVITRLNITEGFDPDDPKGRARLVQRVLDSTTVKLTEQKIGPDLLEIGYRGRDARKVISFVNAVVQKYKDYVLEVYRGEIARARRSLVARRDAAKTGADTALSAYESFQKNNDFQLIGENVLTSRLTELARQREQLADEEVLEQGLIEKLERLRSSVSVTPVETVKRTQKRNPEYEEQRRRVSEASLAIEALKKRGTERHPDYKKLIALVEIEQAKLAAVPELIDVERTSDPSKKFDDLDVRRTEVDAELQAVRARITRLRASSANLETVCKGIPGLNKQAWNLRIDRDHAAETMSRLSDSLISANGLWDRVNGDAGEFFRDLRMPVVEEASTLDPVFPSVPLFGAVGAFVGLLLGGALVFFSEFANSSYTSSAEVRRALSVPLLASVESVISSGTQQKSRKRRKTVTIVLLVLVALVALLHVCFFVHSLQSVLPPALFDLMARFYKVG
ncbi:MAG: hypothetical protein EXS14_07965 [Planctomycetes bacterium]|nr:hypothetical protein [Planctomycetota bacterium]